MVKMFFFSPHSDVSSSDGDLSADGIHRYHCECGRDEMHKGGWQQPIHQEQDRHLWRESVPALRWVSKPTQFNRFGESMYTGVIWDDHTSKLTKKLQTLSDNVNKVFTTLYTACHCAKNE